MIRDTDGVEWGTAAEIARRLENGVTYQMVRQWSDRLGLRKARMTDDNGRTQVRYPYLEAAEIEKKTKGSKRGRRRLLDTSRAIVQTAGKHSCASS